MSFLSIKKNLCNKVAVTLFALFAISVWTVQPAFSQTPEKTLDQLLIDVQKDQIEQRPELKKREQEFISKRNEQKSLLEKVKAELKREELISVQLSKEFEANEKDLTELESRLAMVMGTLGELFGVVRQVAGDTKGQMEASIISAQKPGRQKLASELAQRKELPSIGELEKLWFTLQEEMTESGKVAHFKGSVVLPGGEKSEQMVTRVGTFNLVSEGKYLVWQNETQQMVQLSRQPARRYRSTISDIEEAKAGDETVGFALDPSRGALLSMLVQAPSFLERVNQGGLVGYIILVLLAAGLVLVGERLYVLDKYKKMINAQLQSNTPIPGNPLGEIMQVFIDNKGKSLEDLELKLEETIMRVTPPIERGISTLKVLFAVGPLLGLLGTVTGMIATFQSITLFGTGDPKLMAGGISQALVTTVQGLTCAIPLLLLHNFISTRARGLVQILEEQSAGMLADRTQK